MINDDFDSLITDTIQDDDSSSVAHYCPHCDCPTEWDGLGNEVCYYCQEVVQWNEDMKYPHDN